MDPGVMGRRPVASARSAPTWWNRKWAVSDPGADLRLSPHAPRVGVAHAHESLFVEAQVIFDCPDSVQRQSAPIGRRFGTRFRRPSRAGIVCTGYGTVQGSPLRSDRAHCARLARVSDDPGRMSSSTSARP
jgi:hypothetical protein